MSDLLQNPMLWVTLSFIGFMAVAYRMQLHRKATSALDDRAATIRTELDVARKLKEEAQAVLADYQQKQAAYLKEAEYMMDHARKEADILAANAAKDLAATLEARTQQAIERITRQEQQAISDVRNAVVDQAITAAKTTITNHYQALPSGEMVQDVIADLERKAG